MENITYNILPMTLDSLTFMIMVQNFCELGQEAINTKKYVGREHLFTMWGMLCVF